MFEDDPVCPLFDISVSPGVLAVSNSVMFVIGASASAAAWMVPTELPSVRFSWAPAVPVTTSSSSAITDRVSMKLPVAVSPATTASVVLGDVIFAVGPEEGPRVPLPFVEGLAVLALEEAIERAVRMAKGRDGIPGLADGAS